MNDELERKLQVEISKSGFSHELDVMNKLRNADMLVYPNVTFMDTEDKPHEIDAFALMELQEVEERWKHSSLELSLVVECKASCDRPWVFFDDPSDFANVFGMLDRLICLSDVEVDNSSSLLIGCNNSPLATHHYNDHSLPIARTHFEAFGKDAGKDIHQGVMSLWYALDYFRRLSAYPERKTKRTQILHPVLAFKGILVSATKNEETFELKEVPHILLRTADYITNKNYHFMVHSRETVIDVIRYDYLDQYIAICKHDMALLLAHLAVLDQTGWVVESAKD